MSEIDADKLRKEHESSIIPTVLGVYKANFRGENPLADMSHFSFDPIIDKYGSLRGVTINFVIGNRKIDIESPEFGNNPEYKKYLTGSKPDSDAKEAEAGEPVQETSLAEDNFVRRYPNADMSRFDFVKYPDGSSIEYFKVSDSRRIAVAKPEFQNNPDYSRYLFIGDQGARTPTGWPYIFLAGGTVKEIPNDGSYKPDKQSDIVIRGFPKVRKSGLHNFKVFVSKVDSFDSKLPKIEDNVVLPGNDAKFDTNQSYFSSLCGAYIATYLSGVSVSHLRPSKDIHPIITSIMNFHVYFWISHFIKHPDKIRPYAGLLGPLKEKLPKKGVWNKGHYTYVKRHGRYVDPKIDEFKAGNMKGKILKDVRYSTKKVGMDRLTLRTGIDYYILDTVPLYDKGNFSRFIPDRSDGFTETGRKLLNGSIEVFVYAILGSQSRNLGTPIVSAVSNLSFDVQESFRNIVMDGVDTFDVRSSKTNWVEEMQASIDACNVIPNLAISPHSLLVPSNMLYREAIIPGYNNKIRHVADNMKFGVNKSIGYEGVTDKEESKNQRQEDTPPGIHDTLGKDPKPYAADETPNLAANDTPKPAVSKKPKPNTDETTTAIAVVLAIASFVVLKYVV